MKKWERPQERERECVCVLERKWERERERECVCVREKVRERERERQSQWEE